jgi:type IV secretion system protein TrbE
MGLLSGMIGCAAGAAGAVAAHRLREYREHGDGVADLLGWAFMVGDGVVLQKDGSLLAGWRYPGPDLAAASVEEARAVSRHVSDALLPYADDWMWHVDAVRRPAAAYSAGQFPSEITARIDAERRDAYARAGRRFETTTTLVATWRPPTEQYARLSRWFVRRAAVAGVEWQDMLGAFERSLDGLAGRLRSRLALERLDSDALCTHLHESVTGLAHAIETPADGVYLNVALADQPLVGGFEPRIGERHLRVVAVHGYPTAVPPAALEALGDLPLAYRWSTRVLPLGGERAARLIRRHQLRWFQKRRGAGALIPGTGEPGQAAVWDDQDATAMARDAALAAADNASGRVRFCHVTQVVVVMDPDVAAAESGAAAVTRALTDAGFPARVETVNALDAFLGSLPGHGYANVRRPLLHSGNVADLLPVTSVWPGLASNPSPYFPPGSPPLLWAATNGSTPFRVNLHDSDVGHTLVVGKTGAGKSTLVGLVVAQWQRYPRAQTFVFDVGYSAWLLTHAAGGQHHDIDAGHEASRFQPLAGIDAPAERVWAAQWVEGIVAGQGIEVTAEQRARIAHALALVALAEPRYRTLGELAVHLQDPALAAALRPYLRSRTPGAILDGEADGLAGDGASGSSWSTDFHTFELKAVMERGDAVLVPLLLYLFHRIEQRLDGRPTLIIIEEAWAPLMRSVFAARVRQWLLTLRKENAAVLLVAHGAAQLLDVPGGLLLAEACPTRVFLPNADAAASAASLAAYGALGLGERECQRLARAAPKRDYYMVTPRGRRIFDLALGPTALAVLGTPEGMTTSDVKRVVSRLMEQHGRGWLGVWMRERGVAWT